MGSSCSLKGVKMKIQKGLLRIGKVISKHSPGILTALGVIGMVSAGISAVKNTPKAVDILKKAEEESDEPITIVKKVKLCWKQYVFPVALAIVSIVAIIFARKIDSGRTAALITACKVSEEASEMLKEETREVVGDKAMAKIEENMAKKELQNSPMTDYNVYSTGKGTTLYYESYSGRYFRANRDFVDRARNVFIAQLQDYDTMSVNNYIECFGLPPIDDVTTGRLLGWNINTVKRKCGGHLPELEFVYSEIDTGEVCGYIRLDIDPEIGYDDYHS